MTEPGLHYDPDFVSAADRDEIARWLADAAPALGEALTDARGAPPAGGAAQAAAPGLLARQLAVRVPRLLPPAARRARPLRRRAEPFPPVLARLVARDRAARARASSAAPTCRAAGTSNTCLVNFYGSRARGRPRGSTSRASASTATSSPARSRRCRSASARCSSSSRRGTARRARAVARSSGSTTARCRSSAARWKDAAAPPRAARRPQAAARRSAARSTGFAPAA